MGKGGCWAAPTPALETKNLSTHEKSCPLADPAERERDVDEHEDVGHSDGQDVAVSLSLKLILKTI